MHWWTGNVLYYTTLLFYLSCFSYFSTPRSNSKFYILYCHSYHSISDWIILCDDNFHPKYIILFVYRSLHINKTLYFSWNITLTLLCFSVIFSFFCKKELSLIKVVAMYISPDMEVRILDDTVNNHSICNSRFWLTHQYNVSMSIHLPANFTCKFFILRFKIWNQIKQFVVIKRNKSGKILFLWANTSCLYLLHTWIYFLI